MDDTKVEFIGNPCGQHGPYTFYKAFKFNLEGKCRILTLGEFFFVKIFSEAPVCISELQLLWEDKNNSQLLSSVRLYYLPENTPEGKQGFHGEDEVLAVSEKIILKLDDLVRLIEEGVSWERGSVPITDNEDTPENDKHPINLAKSFAANNFGLQFKGENVDQNIGCDVSNSTQVMILSYPRYCRYKSVMKRLEKCEDSWLRNALVCAIGGFTVKNSNSRVLFCRDTFDDPELDNLEIRCDHLAPNLKGRPRKKRLLSKKESSLESDSGDSNGDLFLPPSGSKTKPSPLTIRTRKESVKNGSQLRDRRNITKEEQHFLQSLHKYMKSRKTPIERIPSLGFKQIDIYVFYTYARKLGGYDQTLESMFKMITQKRLWKHLYDQLGGNRGSTSAATCTRRHYERLLLPYERYLKGEEDRPMSPPMEKSDTEIKNENKKVTSIIPVKLLDKYQDDSKLFPQNSVKAKLEVSRVRSPDVKVEPIEPSNPAPAVDNIRPVLTEQSTNKKVEALDVEKSNSRTDICNRANSTEKSQNLRYRNSPSIFNPVSTQKAAHHPVSPYHAPMLKHPYQKSPSLQSPPHILPAHSRLYNYSPSQFVRSLPGTPPPSLGVKPEDAYNRHMSNASPTVRAGETLRPSLHKEHPSSHRPSVIQHTTQNIKPAHQNSVRERTPHPDHHRPSPARLALPAHSHHLKRCYPPYIDPTALGQPIHHISPYDYASKQVSQPLHSSLKRQRLQDPSSPHYYLAQMRSLAGDYAASKSKGAASNRTPQPSHQPIIPKVNPAEEQPTDLSFKKYPEVSQHQKTGMDLSSKSQSMTPNRSAHVTPNRTVTANHNVTPNRAVTSRHSVTPNRSVHVTPNRTVTANHNVTPNRDSPPSHYRASPSELYQSPLSRCTLSSRSQGSPSLMHAHMKALDRATSRSPHGVSRQISPVPFKPSRIETERTPPSHATTPDLTMAAKTFPSDPNHLLHPAFPHTYLSPPMVPPGMLNISPHQVHNMYQAQMRANVANAAVYEEIAKRNNYLPPGSSSSASIYNTPSKHSTAHPHQPYPH